MDHDHCLQRLKVKAIRQGQGLILWLLNMLSVDELYTTESIPIVRVRVMLWRGLDEASIMMQLIEVMQWQSLSQSSTC